MTTTTAQYPTIDTTGPHTGDTGPQTVQAMTTNTPPLAITKTQTTTRTISKIVIKWERDDMGEGVQWMDELMTLNDNHVEVQDTYEELIKTGGCTPEQARQQTAGNIARVNDWRDDGWQYVGCTVTAEYNESDKATGDYSSTGEVGYESVWGIESFAGKEHQTEVENDLIAELFHSVKAAGYTITPESWSAVPREEAKESYYEPTDPDPGANVRPLQELPADDDEFTYRYGSYSDETSDYSGIDGAEGEILAICKSCGETMLDDEDKKTDEPHGYSCEYYPES